jgi:hypothetical protein
MPDISDNGEQQEATQKAAVTDVRAFVVSGMRASKDKGTIGRELAESGMDAAEASRAVDAVYMDIVRAVQKEMFTPGALQMGILGGLASAVAGGAAWGLIAIHSGYELGIAAWALGFLAGYAVVLFTGGRKGVPLQATAAVSAVLGILVGKYVVFCHYFIEDVKFEHGAEMAESLSYFSWDIILSFFENLPEIAVGFDFLWVVLAIASAWKIPKSMGISLPPQYQTPFPVG